MPHMLRDLIVQEISLVDRPANPGAKVLLAKRDSEPLEKDMYGVGRFAEMLSSLSYILSSAEYEAEAEGDESQVPESMRTWLKDGAKIFRAMAREEVDEFVSSIAKAQAAGNAANTSKESAMDKAVLTKALGLADSATDAEITAAVAKNASDLANTAAELEIAKVGMSTDERAFHDGLKDEDAKKSFRGLAREARADRMAKRDDLPEHVKKALADAEDTRKRLAVLEAKDELAKFEKRAVEIGLTETQGELLMKAHKGDKDALGKLEQTIKGLGEKVRTGKVFAEFGTNKGGDATSPAAQVDAIAADLMKADPTLKRASAISKIAAMPQHREVWQAYKAAGRSAA